MFLPSSFAPPAAVAPRRRFLMATWEGGGHAAPMLSIARALLDRGHEVRVLADPLLRTEVEAWGAEHVPWTTAPHRTTYAMTPEQLARERGIRTPGQAAVHVRDTLICGPSAEFAADTRAELARRGADVVVADHMIPGAAIGAMGEGLPVVLVGTTFMSIPGWGTPPHGAGLRPLAGPVGRLRDAGLRRLGTRLWNAGLPALNAARTANGLPPQAATFDLLGEVDRVLILASAALEFPTFSPPAHVRMVGARTDDPAWAEPWTPPAGDDPLVLVGLSSSFMDQAPVLGRIAAALGGLPVRGVLTTGPFVDPRDVPAPANVAVVRSAPHSEVMRHAAAVVTHAGHGTVAKALSAGLPLVCVPLGRDQHDVTARVVTAGAGVEVKASAAPERIARGVRAVLEDPRHA
ncbi:MAG TPA: glycosyltransferase, partial [Solirubrobacteraceae bacterium]